MTIRSVALLTLLMLPLAGLAQEKVYKTTDAQGNTVFTDMPPTQQAEEVELETPNIADSVEVRPPEPSKPPPAAAPAEAAPETTTTYHGGNDDYREDMYEAKRKQELRERALEGSGAPVAKPAPAPARPRPAPGR